MFICDAAYVMQTVVAAQSLIENRDAGRPVELCIVTDGMSPQQLTAFDQLKRREVRLRFVDGTGRYAAAMGEAGESRYRTATKAALLKFYLPELLPDLDKVLYLDGDIIVRKDLGELFETDISDCYAAAVRDLPQVFYEKQLLGDDREYFNSGVMLMNLANMRRDHMPEKLQQIKNRFQSDQLMDQSAFNAAFAGKLRQLPCEYNVCIANMRRRWIREHMLQKINEAYGTGYKSLGDLRRTCAVLHFSSKEKPWRYYDIPAGDEWLRYYRRTSFGKDRLKRTSWQKIEWRQRFERLRSKTR